MSKYTFPAVMITLNLCQCVLMMIRKDFASAVYWFAAATLNFTVAIK